MTKNPKLAAAVINWNLYNFLRNWNKSEKSCNFSDTEFQT